MLSLKNIYTKPKIVNKARASTITKFMPENISMEYVDMYGRYICHADFACVNSIVLPSIDEQIRIVNNFNTLSFQIGKMHGLDDVFFSLINYNQVELLQKLILINNQIGDIDMNILQIKELIKHLNNSDLANII